MVENIVTNCRRREEGKLSQSEMRRLNPRRHACFSRGCVFEYDDFTKHGNHNTHNARAGALLIHRPAWVDQHTGGSRLTPTVHRCPKGMAVHKQGKHGPFFFLCRTVFSLLDRFFFFAVFFFARPFFFFAGTAFFFFEGPLFFLCEEIRPPYANCTQYQKHYANDADELERRGLFKKSKATVVQRDDMKRLRSEDDEKHKEHIGHDSKHDTTVASLLVQLDGVDSKLHDERIIAVREEPKMHIEFYQRDVPDGMRTPWKLLSCVDPFEESKTARANVHEVKLEWT